MNGFQMVVMPIILLLLIERVVAFFRRRSPRKVVFFWGLIWLVAGTCVAWPSLTSTIARASGIKRGADLVFYCAILFMFLGFSLAYLRIRKLEAALTKLVRHIAVTNPIVPEVHSSNNDPASDKEI